MKRYTKSKNRLIGVGNNPYGLLDDNYNLIKWKNTDRCCDYCNYHKVIRDRIILYKLLRKDN
jgi:hypothetical protein